MGNNQRVVIFIIIGVFMISVLGSAIFLLASGDSGHGDPADDLAAQAAAIEQAQQLQEQVDSQAAQCGPLAPETSTGARALPDYVLPTEDVTQLTSIDLTEGTGAEAQPGSCVVAYYHGTLTDGTVFDSAFERGLPNRFSLLRVIEGWQLGVPGMKEGGVRQLNIPSEQAYGESGSAPVIGPNEDLVFIVELVEVVEI